eukprot:jgi/Galph1/741/GphlegSOOS_G5550.1
MKDNWDGTPMGMIGEKGFLSLGKLSIRRSSYASELFENVVVCCEYQRIIEDLYFKLIPVSDDKEVVVLYAATTLEKSELPTRLPRLVTRVLKFFFRHLNHLCSVPRQDGAEETLLPELPESPCGVLGCTACTQVQFKENESRFRLHQVFEKLDTNVGQEKESDESPTRNDDLLLFCLPDDIFYRILDFLSVKDVRHLMVTCRRAYIIGDSYVPCLNLSLLPHQKKALKFMLKRERKETTKYQNPCIYCLPLPEPYKDWIQYYVDSTNGRISLFPPNSLYFEDFRGGLYCDEPGLGKTVTVLALILKTFRRYAEGPKEEEIFEEVSNSCCVNCVTRYYIPEETSNVERFVPSSDLSPLVCKPSISRVYSSDGSNSPSPSKKRRVQRPDRYNGVHLCEPPTSTVASASFVYISRSTLIVVPSTLLSHWEEQLKMHSRDTIRILRHAGDSFCKVSERCSGRRFPLDMVLHYFDVVLTTFTQVQREYQRAKKSGDSLLLKIHWFRVILDEGHRVGASLSLNYTKMICCALRTDHRWIMTGTPTPKTSLSDVAHLAPLYEFLRDEAFGIGKSVWLRYIQRPFEAGEWEGVDRLESLLQRTMFRTLKSDVDVIPPCIITYKLLSFTPVAALSYNELVSVIRRNLLLADFNDPEHPQSLLNPKNRHVARQAIENVRKSCCIAGHIKLAVIEEEFHEMLLKLSEELKRIFPNDEMAPLEEKQTILEAVEKAIWEGHSCQRCQEWIRLPIITPCGHILCIDCIASSRTCCPLENCKREYRLDKKGVPEDLIELQPGFMQDSWHPIWEDTDSAKVNYLLSELKYLTIEPILENGVWKKKRRKIIIFSQFLEHIFLISNCLGRQGYRYCRVLGALSYQSKMNALYEFRENPLVQILLLDSTGSLGHDLSFVTHIYLMEPVWDQSLASQVISRAHRMGAKEAIHVEILAMQGTVEEMMTCSFDTEKESDFLAETSKEKEAVERMKRSILLNSLHMVHGVVGTKTVDYPRWIGTVDNSTHSVSNGCIPSVSVYRKH